MTKWSCCAQKSLREAASLFMLLAQTFLRGTEWLPVPNATCHCWDTNQHTAWDKATKNRTPEEFRLKQKFMKREFFIQMSVRQITRAKPSLNTSGFAVPEEHKLIALESTSWNNSAYSLIYLFFLKDLLFLIILHLFSLFITVFEENHYMAKVEIRVKVDLHGLLPGCAWCAGHKDWTQSSVAWS